MDNNDDNQSNEISPRIQKVIFAEDLVNYILQKYSLPSVFITTEQRRKCGVSIFDNNLKKAADIINSRTRFETKQAHNFTKGNNLDNMRCFASYANTVKINILEWPFYPEAFLHYSLHLAHLAAKLYVQEFTEAASIAVYYIVEAMDLDLLRSGKAILDHIARKYAEKRRLSIDKVEQPPPHRKRESFVDVNEVQMSVAHEHLNPCEETTKHIHREQYIGVKSSKGREDQHHIVNQNVFNSEKMEEDTATINSSRPSQSISGFENMRTFVFDTHNGNPYNVWSPGYIGVPGSSRREHSNLYSRERFSSDMSEDENGQRKKPRLHHDI